MKTAKQLIEDELQKTIHQLKEVSLLQEEKQALVSYKKGVRTVIVSQKTFGYLSFGTRSYREDYSIASTSYRFC